MPNLDQLLQKNFYTKQNKTGPNKLKLIHIQVKNKFLKRLYKIIFINYFMYNIILTYNNFFFIFISSKSLYK